MPATTGWPVSAASTCSTAGSAPTTCKAAPATTVHVDNAGEWIDELAGEGTDQVLAAVSHELADNVEHLTLTGAGNTSGAGESLANVLVGNAGNNWLAGLAGDVVLVGGLGADKMKGAPVTTATMSTTPATG